MHLTENYLVYHVGRCSSIMFPDDVLINLAYKTTVTDLYKFTGKLEDECSGENPVSPEL